MATALPIPPKDYEPKYFSDLIRALNLFFRRLENPGHVEATTLTLSAIPTSSAGLRAGEVWVDVAAGNVLKVV